ncbi:MAG: AAA family ATPase [Planctomycetia bacterium]|nr:AAA family ATPase [Planctomycetia bacterium]
MEQVDWTKRPFYSEPSAEGFCAVGPVEEVRQRILRCVRRSEGAAMVVGPSGTGKTLLCRVLAQDMENELDVTAVNGRSLSGVSDLFQAMLSQLGIPYGRGGENELRILLSRYLAEYTMDGVLLVVDDAHALRGRILEELRQLMDAVFSRRNALRLVLVGNPTLEEKLNQPRLHDFAQRITLRGFLETLSRDQTVELLRGEIRRAGGVPDGFFDLKVCREIHKLADGVPRTVNQLADHLWYLSESGKKSKISVEDVRAAWRSLQQLPEISDDSILDRPEIQSLEDAPIMKSEKPSSDTVEFGELDDERDDTQNGEQDEQDDGSHSIEFGVLDDSDDSTLLWKRDEEENEDRERAAAAEATAIPDCWNPDGAVAESVSEENLSQTLNASEMRELLNDATAATGEETYPQIPSGPLPKAAEDDLWDIAKEPSTYIRPAEKPESDWAYQAQGRPATGSVVSSGSSMPSASVVSEAYREKFRRNGLRPVASSVEAVNETNRILTEAYLEETVQSFDRLHRVTAALLREVQELHLTGSPSALWKNLHDRGQSALQNILRERFHDTDEAPLSVPPAQNQVSSPESVPEPDFYQPESLLEEGTLLRNDPPEAEKPDTKLDWEELRHMLEKCRGSIGTETDMMNKCYEILSKLREI